MFPGEAVDVGVVIVGIAGHVFSDKRRPFVESVICRNFNLGQTDSLQITGKYIHFPCETLKRDAIAGLFDDRLLAELQQLAGFVGRDFVLKLIAHASFVARLDRQKAFFVDGTDAYRRFRVA